MKIIGTVKKKEISLKGIDIILKIDEIDDLIKFMTFAKESFIERQKDCSVKKLTKNDGIYGSEDITNYSKIVELGHEEFVYHTHYIDYIDSCKTNNETDTDIVLHTTFKAKEKDDDTFEWINKE